VSEKLDELSEEDRKAVKELRESWQDVINSVSCIPIIYDDGKDDGTNIVRAVWAGKPVYGPDAQAKVDTICKAKMEEHARIGAKAFEDTEPLEDVLLPGESRFVPPLGKE